jgi:hypothetical protein
MPELLSTDAHGPDSTEYDLSARGQRVRMQSLQGRLHNGRPLNDSWHRRAIILAIGSDDLRHRTTNRCCLTCLQTTFASSLASTGKSLQEQAYGPPRASGISRGRTNLTSPSKRAASLRSLDFEHVPVMHGGHMMIVPGDRDRVPTRLGDDATVSRVASPANASTLLEVLRFGGGHGASPIAWASILGQTACCCLIYFPIK